MQSIAQQQWQRRLAVASVAATAVACAVLRGSAPAPAEVARVTEYRNGEWFTGSAFAARPVYVVGDVFQSRRPARVDTTIDLAGGYVVPPFADAHQHLVEP